MKHLSEEELTLSYYGDVDPQARQHLEQCPECQAAAARLQRLLSDLPEYEIPERGDAYGGEVWKRLLPRLTPEKPRWWWLNGWTLAPALATVLVIAFFAGMRVQHQKDLQGFTVGARDRVLLITMGSHLDRSEILLAELVNAAPGSLDLTEERSRAADLLGENRVLRLTSARRGDASATAVLDELERLLIDLAHSPSNLSAADLEMLQRRIESEGLLFKVRIIDSNIHEKSQKL
jgi:hypothetical protein